MQGIVKLAAAAVALVVVVGLVVVYLAQPQKEATAFFPRTVGLYESSEVRVLGIPVGEVSEVIPRGENVEVKFTYDGKVQVPRDAAAVLVSPTVVSDRYLQLAPAYTGGPQLGDGAIIPQDRTSVPVELDEVFNNLSTTAAALGPNGANSTGALQDLLGVSRSNLEGNGQKLNDTLTGLSKAVQTLSNSRGDLFGTVGNLQVFTTALKDNDDAVRAFNKDLADVATILDEEKDELALALSSLSGALRDVSGFVNENKGLLESNIEGLTTTTSAILTQQAALEEFADGAATGLGNQELLFNQGTGTLDTRTDLAKSFGDPGTIICGIISSATGDVLDDAACRDVLGALQAGPGGLEALIGQLQQPGADPVAVIGGALGQVGASTATPSPQAQTQGQSGSAGQDQGLATQQNGGAAAPPLPTETRDLTLGGILTAPELPQ